VLEEYFAEIILPLPLKGTFTYQLTKKDYEILSIGTRVAVPFGSRKVHTGLVYKLHQDKPQLYKAKPIHYIIDSSPIVTRRQIELWQWMADYYMCSIGDVFRQALPSALRVDGETFIKRTPHVLQEELTEKEALIILETEKKSSVSIDELAEKLNDKKILRYVKQLLDKKLISTYEKIKQKYAPKLERYIRLSEQIRTDKIIFREVFRGLENAPKQKEILMHLLVLTAEKKPVRLSQLSQIINGGYTSLKALIHKKILEVYFLQTDRTYTEETDLKEILSLSKPQQQAYRSINDAFDEKETVLLHGVTGSGKTEIYIQLIQDVLAEEKQVLFLLPEIAISTQLIFRLKQFFGNDVGCYHSRFNSQERVELWLKTLNNQYKILIGARSALFLPIKKLGLIIVDEEHENHFKQQRPNPLYNARDIAIIWARKHKAKTLLGSATPSLESYYNVKKGKYGFVSLKERFGNVLMPEIQLIDLKKAYKKKEVKGHFSQRMLEAIQDKLDHKKQVIIFQNKRGYAPVLECQSCGHTPYCPNCDVSLTYHKSSHLLKCHYCGYNQAVPKFCPSCRSFDMTTKGLGTEQIEQELTTLFPDYKIGRMDADTTRGKHGFEKIIRAFEAREIDILVGTQMIAKGLDFENIGLVGILRADELLNYPNFRSYERAFQLITQVAGRAGRKKERGKVLIQSFQPEHSILQQVSTYSYEQMAKEILYERQQFIYPPFSRVIIITLKHRLQDKLSKGADILARQLKFSFGDYLLGPETPPIEKINNLYHKKIMIKIRNKKNILPAKQYINKTVEDFSMIRVYRSIQIIIDVDPY